MKPHLKKLETERVLPYIGQADYGQLAVDWIEILGTPKKPVKH